MRKSSAPARTAQIADVPDLWPRTRLARLGESRHSLQTVRLRAGTNHLRGPVFERVPAEVYRSGRVKLLASPGLTLGVAADDLVRIDPQGHVKVIERSLNVAVHWYTDQGAAHLNGMIDAVERAGGWLDGHIPRRLVVLTFPVRVGFPAIEAALDANITRDDQWHFGNVYSDQDIALSWVLPFL